MRRWPNTVTLRCGEGKDGAAVNESFSSQALTSHRAAIDRGLCAVFGITPAQTYTTSSRQRRSARGMTKYLGVDELYQSMKARTCLVCSVSHRILNNVGSESKESRGFTASKSKRLRSGSSDGDGGPKPPKMLGYTQYTKEWPAYITECASLRGRLEEKEEDLHGVKVHDSVDARPEERLPASCQHCSQKLTNHFTLFWPCS